MDTEGLLYYTVAFKNGFFSLKGWSRIAADVVIGLYYHLSGLSPKSTGLQDG